MKNMVRGFESRLKEEAKDPLFQDLYSDAHEAIGIGIKIAQLRKKLGLNQKDLAKRMNTSQQAISRLENGSGGCTLKTLRKIAKVTGSRLEVHFIKE